MRFFHQTYCEFHLGDNLNHLHFLRALTRQNPHHIFMHAAHECHLSQLDEVVEDLRDIKLISLDGREISDLGLNAWKNAGGFFQDHPRRNDYYEFHLEWYRHLAGLMGLASPFEKIEDMLFDYPALMKDPFFPAAENIRDRENAEMEWDFLVVNSRPCSGQLMAYDSVDYFDPLLEELVAKGYRLLVTQPTKVGPENKVNCTQTTFGWSVSEIGAASRRCKHHVMVSTGPSWPPLNKWNYPAPEGHLRMLFLAGERLNLPGLIHVPDLASCRAVLAERGLL